MNSASRWNAIRRAGLYAGLLSTVCAQTPATVENSPCPPAVTTMGPPAPPPEPHFVRPSALDFLKLLPLPPAPESVAGRAELGVVRQVQGWRTPEQEAWAKIVDADCVFNLVDVLGPWFTRQNLPRTEAFFKTLSDDIRVIDRASKLPFARPRPHTADSSIVPCVRIPTSTSYPSGSALQAYLWSELMAEIFPDKRAALETRAQRAAWGRVLGGVHYPSDLVAGQQLVAPFLAECRKSPVFVEGLAEVARELTAAAAIR